MNTRQWLTSGKWSAPTLGLVAAAALITATGCMVSGEQPEPEAADTRTEALCGDYPEKECDPGSVLDYINAHQEDSGNAFFGCIDCAKGLAEAAIIAKGPGWMKLIASVGALYDHVSNANDCRQCVQFVDKTGAMEVLSCTISPCEYSYEAHLAECQSGCGYIGEYGFVPPGAATCICTTSEQEASCRIDCPDDQGYHVNGECYCEKEPPPPPPPECSGGDDGYSCSSDPDTGMDRACCGGSCVLWECSACDWENPYCGQ